ncbi:hypothetical protein [Halobacteriovorax sp. JY17]|uniref:hypothetical protein n=1 Tax=Halobacteriovorax sp. JY17 TaxID=2014617 RepID=UPI0025BEFD76|nr:hypothetical protein [Halobacteriovorax sp. JY17]
MMKVLLCLLLFVSNSFAMCEYPHNPPAICLAGKVTKSVPVKAKNYRCLLSVAVKEIVRPPRTYVFNSNLDRVDFKNAQKLSAKTIKLYSKKNCDAKEIRTIAEYNCNDRNADIADMSLLDAESIQLKVRDPWTEKNPLIDCSPLLSK